MEAIEALAVIERLVLGNAREVMFMHALATFVRAAGTGEAGARSTTMSKARARRAAGMGETGMRGAACAHAAMTAAATTTAVTTAAATTTAVTAAAATTTTTTWMGKGASRAGEHQQGDEDCEIAFHGGDLLVRVNGRFCSGAFISDS